MRFLVTYAVSVLFLFCATRIHQGNPQGYDVYLPSFLLLFIYFFDCSGSSIPSKSQCWCAVFAGTALSLAELTRPFMIYLLPVAIAIVFIKYYRFRKFGLILATLFLIPIVALSGSFHVYKWVKHQQLTFSNNTGFNLSRAWGRLIVVPPLLDESKYVVSKEGRWPNLDTDEHQINSERFKQAVMNAWLTRPVQSASFAIGLLNEFLVGETRIYEHNPNSIFLQTYKLVYKCVASLLLINCFILVTGLLIQPRRAVALITNLDNLVILMTTFLILIFAIGEKGEEARFIISVLPLLSLVPLARLSAVDAESPLRSDSSKISFKW
jgi:4-amino-4-deoxy-L-arabinose transferase-like glycosyltransferase